MNSEQLDAAWAFYDSIGEFRYEPDEPHEAPK